MSASFFKALADENRLKAFVALAGFGRPCTVSEIAACCPTEFSVTSRHLASLRQAGLLSATKVGREVHYEINARDLASTLRAIADSIESCYTQKGDDHGETQIKLETRRKSNGNPPTGVPGLY